MDTRKPGPWQKRKPEHVKPGKRAPKEQTEARIRNFIENYIATGNAKDSAIAAGYSPKSAAAIGCQLAKRPDVVQAMKARQEVLARKFELQTDDVLRELSAIVHFDPRRLFDEVGGLIRIKDLPEDVAKAIAGIDVAIKMEGKDVIRVMKLRFADKNAAIEKAMKHLGLFERDNKQQTNAMTELLAHVAAHNQPVPVTQCLPTTSQTGNPSAGG